MFKEVFNSEYDGHPDYVASDKELSNYLEMIAAEIGWIVIHFNSLEDVLGQFLREMVLRDPDQDERLDVFLSGMGYQEKKCALMELYGQAENFGGWKFPEGVDRELDKALSLAATIRNGYAHADWIGLREDAYVKVKTVSNKKGVVHRYKRIDRQAARRDLIFIINVRERLEAVHELVQDLIYGRIAPEDANLRALPEIALPGVDLNGAVVDEVLADIFNALLALGFAENEVQNALKKLPHGTSVSDGIKIALQRIERSAGRRKPNDIPLKK